MNLSRPLAFIDTETTGTDPAEDRIISMAVKLVNPDQSTVSYEYLFDPERPIPPDATAIHGITDAMVVSKPPFRQMARMIHAGLRDCDLAGFCLRDFDVPILWEEFYRAGISWNLTGVRIVDAGVIYKVREERTLTAALKFYCNEDHAGADGAMADVSATSKVLLGQIAKYPDLPTDVSGLAAIADDGRIDLAGKIVKGKDGRPTYAIGKAKGVAVVDDKGFGHYMLKNGFSEQTKQVLRALLT